MEAEEAAGFQELAEVGTELRGAERGRDAADQAVPGRAAIAAATAGCRHLGPAVLTRGDDVRVEGAAWWRGSARQRR